MFTSGISHRFLDRGLVSFFFLGFNNWSLVSHHELLSNPIQNKIKQKIGLRMAMVAIDARRCEALGGTEDGMRTNSRAQGRGSETDAV
jgi:hypothetical protein